MQVHNPFGAGLAAGSARVVVALADRHPAAAVGDVVQVRREHLARPQPAVRHQQERRQVAQPLQAADELLVHRTR
ncbi:hypothetical protein ACIRP7_19730 [Streptomyces sp. NPDC102270]|uniref:hypothetical protein n=1 Tax=Streptomyces sp. NPDC102270 TaxID=3366150 RepID=UPI003805394C